MYHVRTPLYTMLLLTQGTPLQRQLVCTLYRCPCKHNTEKSARMKNLFRTKFGKRVLIGGILLLAAALCGFAAVLSSFLPEPWNGLAANGCVVLFLRLHAKHKAEPDGGTPERNAGEAYDNTTEAGSSVSAYTYSGALGVPYAFVR